MASYTTNLNLLKKSPVTDGNDTFNVDTMLNENWDKIDKFSSEIDGNFSSLKSTVVSGTYTGNASSTGTTSQTISLGFTPIAVFAVQKGTNFDEASIYDNYAALAVTGSPAIDYYGDNSLVITNNGFTVYGTERKGLNANGAFYNYIALKKVNL